MVYYCIRRPIKDNLIAEVILVGITCDTTYKSYVNNGQRDHNPTKTRLPFTGGSNLFLDFFNKELVPFIKSNYRNTVDRSIVGHSLGSLIGLSSLLTKSFNRNILISPSLWYDNKYLFDVLGH